MRTKIVSLLHNLANLIEPKETTISSLQKQLPKIGATTITDKLTLSIIVIGSDGSIIYVSPYTEVLTGYHASEIKKIGKQFLRSIIVPEYHELFDRSLKFHEAGEPYQYQHRFTHKSGITVWAETRTSPIILNETMLGEGLLMVTLNISQQMVYQRQVEVRTREVEDFTYMVSHDLKAPLFTIKGMLELFQEETPRLSDQGRELTIYLDRAVSRLETLINSVLAYAKVTSTNFPIEAVDLNKVAREISEEFTTILAGVSGTLIIEPNLPTVEAEHTRMYQVLANLVGNAVKYRDHNRQLEVEIGVLPSKSNRQSTIFVRDNAEGIPKDKLDSVFRAFHRNHGHEIEGTGIGLTCVRKLVERFGGEIELDSEVGKGSTFFLTFRLPALSRFVN
jgi:two-component system, sporulation sensor kinase E